MVTMNCNFLEKNCVKMISFCFPTSLEWHEIYIFWGVNYIFKDHSCQILAQKCQNSQQNVKMKQCISPKYPTVISIHWFLFDVYVDFVSSGG